MPVAVAWVLREFRRRVLMYLFKRTVGPVIKPLEREVIRLGIGVVLGFCGFVAAVVCGLVLTPVMALPGFAAWLLGWWLCIKAIRNTKRAGIQTFVNARTWYHQGAAFSRRTWLRLRGFRRRPNKSEVTRG